MKSDNNYEDWYLSCEAYKNCQVRILRQRGYPPSILVTVLLALLAQTVKSNILGGFL